MMDYKSLCFKAEASFYEMSGGESFPKGHTLQSLFFSIVLWKSQ